MRKAFACIDSSIISIIPQFIQYEAISTRLNRTFGLDSHFYLTEDILDITSMASFQDFISNDLNGEPGCFGFYSIHQFFRNSKDWEERLKVVIMSGHILLFLRERLVIDSIKLLHSKKIELRLAFLEYQSKYSNIYHYILEKSFE